MSDADKNLETTCLEMRRMEVLGIYPPGYHDSHCFLIKENKCQIMSSH